jgi:adenylate kinase
MKSREKENEYIVGPVPARPTILCVLGPPGAGKTTLAKKLSRTPNSVYFSTSDFLRHLSSEHGSTPEGDYIKKSLNKGVNIDSSIIHEKIYALIKEMTEELIILDGFPRTVNAMKFIKNKVLNQYYLCFIHVYSDIPTCKSRFLLKSSDQTIFYRRMDWYTRVERQLLSNTGPYPTFNVRT